MHLPVLALEVGVSSDTSHSVFESGVSQRVAVWWHRPSRTRCLAPSVTPDLDAQWGRVGTREARPVQVHQALDRSPEGALPRPSAPPPRASRVKVKVPGGPSAGQGLGGGAGADVGAGAGHWRGHGWARPPPPSQPETEARPRGLVRVTARGRGRGDLGARTVYSVRHRGTRSRSSLGGIWEG